jgi:type II secretory pathway pseudopilin PulG
VNNHNPIPRQRGATLIAALLILALMALLAVYGVGLSVTDQRSSANEFRTKEASLAAESGVEQAIAYVDINRGQIAAGAWTACAGTADTPPCVAVPSADRANWGYRAIPSAQLVQPASGANVVFLMTPTAGAGKNLLFNLVSEGSSADGSAKKVIRQGVYFYPLIIREPDSPLLAAGDIAFNGNFSIVTNPNGAGPGIPLTVWSSADTSVDSGSPATCQLSEFLATDSSYETQTDSDGNVLTMCAQCTCPSSSALSTNGVEGIDILDVDGGLGANADASAFPVDVFEYVFGVKTADYAQIKRQATVVSSCAELNTASSGIYWVTGNCSPPGDVGSFANPVMVVVEGSSKINSNNYFFGVLFAFSTNPATSLDLDLNGTPTLYGAILTNAKISISNGNYKMRFDAKVLKNLSSNPASRGLAKVPGSWGDF